MAELRGPALASERRLPLLLLTGFGLMLRVCTGEDEVAFGLTEQGADEASRWIELRGLGGRPKRSWQVELAEQLRATQTGGAPEAAGVLVRYASEGEADTRGPALVLALSERAGALDLILVDHSGRLSRAELEYALALSLRLARRLVESGELPLSLDDVLSPVQLREQVFDFNATEAALEPDEALHSAFLRWAKRSPDAIALIHGDRRWSYAELAERATELARRLPELEPSEPVILSLGPGPEAIVAMLAIWFAGGAYVPVDPELPVERRRMMIEAAGARVSVCDDRELEPDASALERCFGGAHLGSKGPSERELPRGVASGELAYIIFTSGSTGRPKGVMIEHRSAVNLVRCINERFEVGPGDRLLLASSLGFDLSVYDVFGALSAGAALVIPDGPDPRDPFMLARCVEAHGVSVWNSVPSTMGLMIEARGEALASLRVILLSGDWIPVDLPGRVRAQNPSARIIALGGATEGTVWSNAFELGEVDPSWGSIPYGYPLRNNAFYVLGPDRLPVPRGVTGELAIGGVGVARGYVSAPELSARAFVEPRFETPFAGPIYLTGDLGRLTFEGHLEIIGRLDTQVKVNGYRVELGEVEHALRGHEALAAAVVSCVQRRSGGQELVVHAVAEGSDKPEMAAINERLRARLPPYMLPARIMYLDRLPLSANGKIARKRLPKFGPRVGSLALSDDLAATLAQLWREALRLEHFGEDDDFISCGGSSLAAVRLILAIEHELGLRLSVARLLELGSFARLLAFVRERGQRSEGASISLAGPGGRNHELTPLQAAYVLGEDGEFPLGGSVGHVHQEFDVEVWALARLDEALRRLLATHEMLRASIVGGERWMVHEHVEPPLRRIDLRGRSASEVEAELGELRETQRREGLPSCRWPLFDLTAVELDTGAKLFLRFDLALFDGVSHAALLAELEQLLTSPSCALRAPHSSYFEYRAAWKRFELGPRYAAAKTFWHERAASLPEPPQLPLARSPAQLGRSLLAQRRVDINAEQWRALAERAEAERLGLGNVVLAAFCQVVSRWSAAPRFCLNLLYYNRESLVDDVDAIVGNFSSTLLLAAEVRAREAFGQLVRRLGAQLSEQLKYAIYDGVDVLAERKRATRSLDAGMPVVFTSLLGMRPRGERSLLHERSLGVQTPHVHLDCLLRERGEAAEVIWSYQEGLYPEHLIEDMCGAFAQLLAKLARPETAWDEWQLVVLPSWQRALLERCEAPPPVEVQAVLTDGLRAQARNSPRRVALRAPTRTLDYAGLLRAAWVVAGRLTALGVRDNALVGVCLGKGWLQPVALVGVIEAGAAYLPLRPDDPDERLSQLAELSRIEVLICDAHGAERLRRVLPELKLLSLDEAILSGPDPSPPSARPRPEDLAYVMYTSGSTGVPKGVRIAHAGVVNTIVDVNTSLELGPEDRVFAASAYGFDLSVYDLFGTLAAGAELIMPAPGEIREPERVLARMRELGVTVWNSVPALMEMLVDYVGRGRGPKLRAVLLSGDWIPLSLPDRVRAVFGPEQLLSLGGATEASIWSIMFPVAEVDPAWRSIPYGKAMAGQSLVVLDHELEPAPVGVAGEAYIGGVGVALGYLGDAERTAASFIAHPDTGARLYKTGDQCRLHADGNVEILGRLDLQVKVRGHRIELGELEAVTRALFPELDAVAAVGRWHGEAQLVLYLRAHAGGSVPEGAEVLAAIAERLPSYCVPTATIPVDRWPMSANGKVDRKRLPAPAQDRNVTVCEPPRGDLERRIGQIWVELLGLPHVHRNDSFFDLGGQSMSAVRLSARVREEIGGKLPLATIYAEETLAGIAAWVEADVGRTPKSLRPTNLVSLNGGGPRPPLFLSHPIGGHVLAYYELAQRLGDHGYPVYALQADGLEGDAGPRDSVRALAEHYLECVRRVQPKGPLRLGGWSFGGLVAYEMGRLMRAEGREPGEVVLIDAWFPSLVEEAVADEAMVARSFLEDLRTSLQLGPVAATASPAEALAQTAAHMGLGDEGSTTLARMRETYAAHLRAMVSYDPPATPLSLLLLKGSRSRPSSYYRGPFSPALSWDAVAATRVVELDADHYSLLREPRLSELCRHLLETLDD